MTFVSRRTFISFLCLLMLNTVLAAGNSPEWTKVFEKTTNAVVKVQATTVQERNANPFDEAPFSKKFSPRVNERKVGGSGFFIDNKGMLLTTQSAVGNAKVASVELVNGTRYQAKVIGADEILDIALLRIDNFSSNALVLTDSTSLSVGASVATVGFPYEMNQRSRYD